MDVKRGYTKSEVVVKEVYNGVLDFYVDYGFASSIYDDWFWKIFYEKGSQGNKFSIWISDFDVYDIMGQFSRQKSKIFIMN